MQTQVPEMLTFAKGLKQTPRSNHTAYPSGKMPLITLRYAAQMNERNFQKPGHERRSPLGYN